MDIVKSINGVPIRLTEERWVHIIENHDDMAGYYDEVLGVNDGFIITAYFTSKIKLEREVIIWQQQK
jgi:hypothetical protein